MADETWAPGFQEVLLILSVQLGVLSFVWEILQGPLPGPSKVPQLGGTCNSPVGGWVRVTGDDIQ